MRERRLRDRGDRVCKQSQAQCSKSPHDLSPWIFRCVTPRTPETSARPISLCSFLQATQHHLSAKEGSLPALRGRFNRMQRPNRVISGKARPEYLTSAFHPIADLIADIIGGPLRARSRLTHRGNRGFIRSLDQPARVTSAGLRCQAPSQFSS
jgi:hypothetical protein